MKTASESLLSCMQAAAAAPSALTAAELPHVRDQGSGLECQAETVQEQPRSCTFEVRDAAGRSHPASEVRRWLGGATHL